MTSERERSEQPAREAVPAVPWEAVRARWEATGRALWEERERAWREKERARLEQRARLPHFLLAIAVRLMPPSERNRYLEEFRAELLDVPGDTRLSHAQSLLRGVFVLRLRRGLKNKAADAAARRAKS